MTTASGLQYQVITEGKGPKPEADRRGAACTTRARCSTARPSTAPTTAASRRRSCSASVVPGWQEGIALMPVGSKYKLLDPEQARLRRAGHAGPDRPERDAGVRSRAARHRQAGRASKSHAHHGSAGSGHCRRRLPHRYRSASSRPEDLHARHHLRHRLRRPGHRHLPGRRRPRRGLRRHRPGQGRRPQPRRDPDLRAGPGADGEGQPRRRPPALHHRRRGGDRAWRHHLHRRRHAAGRRRQRRPASTCWRWRARSASTSSGRRWSSTSRPCRSAPPTRCARRSPRSWPRAAPTSPSTSSPIRNSSRKATRSTTACVRTAS